MQPVRDYLQVVQVGEAASFLGVSPNTVRNWSRKGKIPTHRHPVNGYRLYKQEDLEALLLDILLDQHPEGQYIRGKWEGLGAAKPDLPSDTLILELLQKPPTALLLDEFQTWFDGLVNTKQEPKRN